MLNRVRAKEAIYIFKLRAGYDDLKTHLKLDINCQKQNPNGVEDALGTETVKHIINDCN